MKKIFIFILLALFLVGFIFTIQADDDDELEADINENNGDETEDDSYERVCCKVYGLGSRMRHVNIRYGWIEEDECVTPEEFVGGGREIVDDDYCENRGLGVRILNQTQIQNITRERNRLRIQAQDGECPPDNCICTGSTVKCEIDGGREMTVYAGGSGNTIVQVKGVKMATIVTLFKSEGEVYGVFRNNETRPINFFPDDIQTKIKRKLQNQTIELDEDGIYQVQGKKKARLFFLFPVRERVRAQINSETGEVIRIRNPWWGFLARDTRETEEENETEE